MAYEGLLALMQNMGQRPAPIFSQNLGMNPANVPQLPDFNMMQQQPEMVPMMPSTPVQPSPSMMPPAPQSSGGTGFMDFVRSPGAKGLLYGAGIGLLKKMNNTNETIIPDAIAGIEKYQKQDAMNQMANQINSANLTPAQKAFVQTAFMTGDEKMIAAAAKMITPSTNTRTTNPILNAEALGLKPGTKQYNDYIREQTVGKSTNSFMKNEMAFAQQVANENNLEGAELEEAIEVLKSGGNQLANGKQLVFSQTAREKLGAIKKAGTTSQLMTQGVQANQAETEIKVLSDFAQAGLKKYGNTYGGYSPSQIAAALSTDTKDALSLGRFVASQQLQFEIAQNQIKLANGQPGVTTTQELMDLGMQHINAKYPRMTNQTRQEAQRYFTTALSHGLKARNRMGIDVGAATGQNSFNAYQKTLLLNADEAIRQGADPELVYSRIDELWGKKQ